MHICMCVEEYTHTHTHVKSFIPQRDHHLQNNLLAKIERNMNVYKYYFKFYLLSGTYKEKLLYILNFILSLVF